MSSGRPLVPVDYGTTQLEKLDGSGVLTAACTDLARLGAIMIDTGDSPALSRSSVSDMLVRGMANQAKFGGRSGHGWDQTRALPAGRFYAQKGGSLSTSGGVAQFNGDWGFVMLWVGKNIAPYKGKQWYPDFTAVMDAA